MPAGSKIRRIGVLTGGGDCPGLNAVIRGVTKPAQDFGMTVFGIQDGFEGLVEGKAKELTNMLSNTFGAKITSGTLSSSTLKTELENADIIINATSVGMRPYVESSLVPSDLLHSNLCVMDIIYNPLTTKLLNDAKSVGAIAISGLEMLIYQGAIAFEIWTNCPAPVEVMRNAALNALEKRGEHF